MFHLFYRLLAGLARLAARSGRSKDLEIIVLRHQLSVLRRTTKPVVTDLDRSLLAAIARSCGWPARTRRGLIRSTLIRSRLITVERFLIV